MGAVTAQDFFHRSHVVRAGHFFFFRRCFSFTLFFPALLSLSLLSLLYFSPILFMNRGFRFVSCRVRLSCGYAGFLRDKLGFNSQTY